MVPQAAFIVSIAGIVVSGLLLVRFLDKPYENQSGSIRPTAMARSLALMQGDLHRQGPRPAIRCA